MRATFFKEVGKPLSIETCPDPVPGTGEVVVKVGRCGICGTDLHMTSQHDISYPPGFAMGHEFCGEVVAVGAEVTRFKQGDLLSAMALIGCGKCAACLSGYPYSCKQMQMQMPGFAEYARVNATFAIKLPAMLSLVDGALVEPFAAALRGVYLSRIYAGAKVLVLGLGAMGMGAIYWSRRLGAGKIVASARSPWREAIAKEVGATAFVANDADLAGNAAEVLGGPPDIVFECAGVPGILDEAVKQVKPHGTIAVLGGCITPDTFRPFTAMIKEVCLQFCAGYTLQDFQFTADTFERGALEPRSMVTETISLDALPAMFESLRSPNRQCKVMVDPWMKN